MIGGWNGTDFGSLGQNLSMLVPALHTVRLQHVDVGAMGLDRADRDRPPVRTRYPSAAVLVCPLAMIVAMTVLMGGGTQQRTGDHTDAPAEPVELP